jgi:hypothetical protein
MKTDRPRVSRAAILEFLRSRSAEACFLSEVVASLGAPGLGSEEVEACLCQLHAEGQVWLEEFAAPDPHLPPRILVATVIDPSLSAGEARDAARSRVQRAFEVWFREFLMAHRCV